MNVGRVAAGAAIAVLAIGGMACLLIFREPPPPPQQYRIDVTCRVGVKRVEHLDAKEAYRWLGLGGWTIVERDGKRITHGATVPCTKTETPI